jgi:DNA polymerase-1
MPRNTLLLDADQIAYKACFAVEQPIKWDEDTWTLHASEAEVAMVIENLVEKAKKDTGLHENILFGMSSSHNFRKELYPEYKSNRDDKRKPVALTFALQYIRDNWPTLTIPHLEADDVIGIMATKWKTSVIWAIDKDFLTVPCTIYFREKDLLFIDEEQASRNLMLQVLQGDPTDCYAGIEGVGPKKAEKYLEAYGYTWDSVLKLYKEHGYGYEYFETMARMARICRKRSDRYAWRPPVAEAAEHRLRPVR